MNSNKWEEGADSEYEDEEFHQNEVPPPVINQQFMDNILDVKHKLYDAIVFAPELGTDAAQSDIVLKEYLSKINSVYVMSVNAQNGKKIVGNKINNFPPETREAIARTLDWISVFFSKNTPADTIPYSDFIRKHYLEYQFDQRKSFD